MGDSLREQLLALGLAKKAEKTAPARARGGPVNPRQSSAAGRSTAGAGANQKPRPSLEPDLAHAYAARARAERAEREQAEREAQAKAREKRERRQKLVALLEGQARNAAEAEIARHFAHGGKIRRVYVTAEQLSKLNAGELAVVQRDGRYLLVSREVALAAREIQPESVVLLVDPGAAADDDVPADLVW